MMKSRGGKPEYRCSFCGKSQEDVERLIAGPGTVYICNECVELCREIISEESVPVAGGENPSAKPPEGFDLNTYTDVTSRQIRKTRQLVGIIMGSKSDWATMQNA